MRYGKNSSAFLKKQRVFTNRIASHYLLKIKNQKNRMKETIKVYGLCLGGSFYNQGKTNFTLVAGHLASVFSCSQRLTEKVLQELRNEGYLFVREQGYCIRKSGKRAIVGFKNTVYSLTEKALDFLNSITNGFFVGIKKQVRMIISKVEEAFEPLDPEIAKNFIAKLRERSRLEKINQLQGV